MAKLVYHAVGDKAARWLHESGSINAVAAVLKAAFRAHSRVMNSAVGVTLAQDTAATTQRCVKPAAVRITSAMNYQVLKPG
jgi:hypothetical protein